MAEKRNYHPALKWLITSLKAFGLLIGALVLVLVTWILVDKDFRVSPNGHLRLSPNISTIEKGEVYRSAQLFPDELKQTVSQLGIRTIINLRGTQEHEPWYRKQKALAKEQNIEMIDIGMNAHELPKRQSLLSLYAAFDHAERPILIHCRAGADRTGAIATIYQMDYMNQPKNQAQNQLSWDFWHIRFFTPAPSYFVSLYEGRNWAESNYFPCQANYKYFEKHKRCRP